MRVPQRRRHDVFLRIRLPILCDVKHKILRTGFRIDLDAAAARSFHLVQTCLTRDMNDPRRRFGKLRRFHQRRNARRLDGIGPGLCMRHRIEPPRFMQLPDARVLQIVVFTVYADNAVFPLHKVKRVINLPVRYPHRGVYHVHLE